MSENIIEVSFKDGIQKLPIFDSFNEMKSFIENLYQLKILENINTLDEFLNLFNNKEEILSNLFETKGSNTFDWAIDCGKANQIEYKKISWWPLAEGCFKHNNEIYWFDIDASEF